MATPVSEGWRARLWHGIDASAWMDEWLSLRLQSEWKALNNIRVEHPLFERAIRREKRNLIDRLIRGQGVLPWFQKRSPLFKERGLLPGTRPAQLTAFDHLIPVHQLKSLVEMAIDGENWAAPVERLKFAWLCPAVLITPETHRTVSKGEKRRCGDFRMPFSRFARLEGVTLVDHREREIDPAKFTLAELGDRLNETGIVGDVTRFFGDFTLPSAEDEKDWTSKNVRYREPE
ncbi:hypothetical protein [Ancylobacter terrae]|uniref:hypothetical protein n=1 Tax=Ancylobacter sp. sgz301288 TaxID=3342077 RepID=UPI00385B8DCF